ncbi:hypothetical protein EDB81DRAFT_205368 [Dactylonectria macrodidyma]|uniref:Secreted protein n=1 Tax=Dactylonectria macrodidyma TaxID=307937 RepID=A0A9P9DW84_9HYPO|nr:hypothetical protein EDB81DRAFT_205368 [Dactylonectria macrodidyma]
MLILLLPFFLLLVLRGKQGAAAEYQTVARQYIDSYLGHRCVGGRKGDGRTGVEGAGGRAGRRGPPCLEEAHCVSTWRSSRWRWAVLGAKVQDALGFLARLRWREQPSRGSQSATAAGVRRARKRTQSGGRRAMFCLLYRC